MSPESEAAILVVKSGADGKRIVFVSGHFNIIHPGHLRLLRFAKECGDYLVVGVLDSKSDGALVNENLRLEAIQSISWVDLGFLLREAPEGFIERLNPAVVVKGKEFESRSNPELDAVKSGGGKLLFGSGEFTFSSTDLLRQEMHSLNLSTIKKPIDYLDRHQFGFADLLQTINLVQKLRVLVIGDTIVDEYVSCDPVGMSREDPTLVVTPILTETFIGGAAIVAAHARSLGARVNFLSVTGADSTATFVRGKLDEVHVNAKLYADESRPTTLKQRFQAERKSLLKVSRLRQHAISPEIRARMLEDAIDLLDETDLLIFADFNYGCLPQPLVDGIVKRAIQKKVLMVADSQSSSQVGDVSRFKNMALLTPTEREARIALQDFDSGLVILAEKLRARANARNVVVTLGGEGILIHAAAPKEWLTDRLGSFNTAPRDASGAGDSFLTAASLALALGRDIWHACYLGSLAAACQVGRTGNLPLTVQDLNAEIQS